MSAFDTKYAQPETCSLCKSNKQYSTRKALSKVDFIWKSRQHSLPLLGSTQVEVKTDQCQHLHEERQWCQLATGYHRHVFFIHYCYEPCCSNANEEKKMVPIIGPTLAKLHSTKNRCIVPLCHSHNGETVVSNEKVGSTKEEQQQQLLEVGLREMVIMAWPF